MKPFQQVARSLALAATASLALNAPAAPAPVVQSRYAVTERVTLHYLESGHGDGTPVILLHGYTETSRMWRPLMAGLGDGRTVIAPDLPGEGDSGIPADGYD